jgi:adenosylcobinamide-GDP ribazoletransferase
VNPIVRQAQLFVCAVQFLTRLPTPRLADFEPDWIARSVRYFPLAGQLVGLLSAAVWLAAGRVWPGLPAAMAIGAGVLITGGFHEDGLADTADGLGGGRDRAQKLLIMKDSRLGSYGALALGLVTALRIAALAACPPWAGALALIVAHGAARAAAVVVMAALPYAGDVDAAKVAPPTRGPGWTEVAIALLLGGWPLLLLPPGKALLAIGLAAAATVGMAVIARRQIDGVTGDVLGAIEQLAEAALLCGAAS